MNEKSEQIDSRLNVLVDNDQPLSPRKLEDAVMLALHGGKAERYKVSVEGTTHPFVAYTSATDNNHKHALLPAAVTFLGGNKNHPIFKKRIQLKSWFKPVHNALTRQGYKVHFLGVYHYKGNIVFVDFATETYMRRKMHNSSAFVYVNDLFRAMKDGIATRVDLHGNTITTIRRNCFESYLDDMLESGGDNELFNVFSGFNKRMPFLRWIKGASAIKEMHSAKWSKWKETEWPGWYLEFKFASYLNNNGISAVVYQGNAGKKKGALDFDLLFPVQKFYGDLKASDISKKESPGNDKESLFTAINKFDRFWYVIYEHETVKDKDCGNQLTRFRYEYLVRIGDKAKSPLSYAARMKNRVYFKRMMILELNRANCGKLLSTFHQGRQPDGGARAEKVLINKRNVENYQVFHYEA